ncbi:uncharacterized protein LOC106181926 isoform X1 [Lingula anatina]|uniref:Uncharacterized protein LOC106181926 isoform X1 n=2 Tax=Lingula anatina TaxID=7574 RepID=A0A1S3KI91_LINAN|nr:uncharacterized protein LOC106181926 isoform X1 [Lingula anatina]XP_013421932.1 uncharacterized protein LOC106181926 isoform X1 [Lingula anatina]XP_013421935.1 uncharacterized protein LOC106181926 isoform X1 [Lingula anatina]XP_013421936.1 uncharacterized protein LOC106181926 isoform X1 [Lingula anatina]XP_013421942.1 uncharacterized protein LOC106181926 isoform X1 [Lingula anatina]|eukprot:XP_013421930.1 uncharacterized protein LOC106181926 isoform X1 [Lingula anatina]
MKQRRAVMRGRQRWGQLLVLMVTAFVCFNVWLTLRLKTNTSPAESSDVIVINARARQSERNTKDVLGHFTPDATPSKPPVPLLPQTQLSDNYNLTIVTASNKKFYKALVNFVGSVHFWEPSTNLVIYDLGLRESQREFIQTWCRTELLKFDFKSFPPHFATVDQFAWKPIIIREAVRRFGVILWSDAGSDIRGPLTKIREYLHLDKYFFVQGQDTDMVETCHKMMFDYLHQNVTRFKGKYSYAGGLHGWVKDSRAFNEILQPWVTCAMNVDCISPNGASLYDHRFDQSALSILAHSSGLNITAHTELLAAHRSQVNKDKSVESPMIVHTARGRNRDYMEFLCYDISKWDRKREGRDINFY